MDTEINQVKLNAAEMFDKLDAKDGKADNKIQASVWNEFAETAGGKKIKSCILKENALKSISSYLNRADEQTIGDIVNFVGQSDGKEETKSKEKVELIDDLKVKPKQKTEEKISVENKTGDQVFDELDAKDGKKDGVIRAAAWNEFAQEFGGKKINSCILKENALKSINTYLNRAGKANAPTPAPTLAPAPAPVVATNTPVYSNNNFEQDTMDLINQRFEHATNLLTVAQDSLGLYEITAAEYEVMKKENPEELKNTQAVIVGDYGMKNGHQWCAYTVSYLAKEAGMDVPRMSSVQGYIDRYQDDYNKIQTNKMTVQNCQEERANRAEQIKAQLPKMKEGDFIIWKGDYVVNVSNGQASYNKASHIGIIEHVDVENGIVTVIEGNANISEMDDNNERVPVRTAADCKRGAQIRGEYKDVNMRDGLIRKQYTIEELSKHGYTGFIDNSDRIK